MEHEKVTFRDRIKAFVNPHARSAENATLTASLAALTGGFASESGVTVTQESSLAFAAVWQARRILSELPASLPVVVYEQNGPNRIAIDHDVKRILAEPNPYMNGFTWTELMNDKLQGWGNGVAVIDGEKLIPVDPGCVDVRIYQGRLFYTINDSNMGIYGTFFPEEVIHYKGFTTDGLWGKSPILMGKNNIGLGLAAEKFGARFFKKGGNIKNVIETAGHIPDKEFKEWKKRWDAFYSGEAGDHVTPVLEYGMTLKPLGIAPEAAQFLQTRQFSIQDVARWFNLPPHMLGDLSRATFSNIEHQDLQFVKYTLRPILKRQELELENKLLLPKERGKILIRFNLDEMMRADLNTLTLHLKEMYLAGILNKDEARALLNRNSVEGGDVFLTPANITGKNNTPNNDTKKDNNQGE